MACSDTNQEMLGKMLLLGAPSLQSNYGLKGYRTMINSGAEGRARGFSYAFSCLRWK